jgi:hypothetical protein
MGVKLGCVISREEVPEKRTLHNERLHDIYSSPDVITMMIKMMR